VRRNAGAFDFNGGDEVVHFAQAYSMRVRGHCLVWDHNNPAWLAQGNFTPAQLSHLLQEHITTVMRHYAGQVFAWDVVNEALDATGRVKDSLWYNQPGIGLSDKGTAYVEQTFRWAHEADPQPLLFYNEAEGEGLNQKSDAIYAMVKDFKHRGVPIDGIGLQMHISRLDFDTAAIAANIARLTALGVQVHITELDVSLPGGLQRPSAERRSSSSGRGVSQRGAGVSAESRLHRDSDLGIHRQIFVDWIALARHAGCSAAV
jgi:endo-1,4-beta-xylanase